MAIAVALALLAVGARRAPADPASDPGPWLIFDVAKSAYAASNQGGAFVVEIADGDQRQVVHRVIWGAETGVWLPQAVNLSDYAGHTVKLRLETVAAYYLGRECQLFWGRPQIVVGPLNQPQTLQVATDLTELCRLGQNCRAWIRDPDNSLPLQQNSWKYTGRYFDFGNAGPYVLPAIYDPPYTRGTNAWAGFEFNVTIPPRPEAHGPAAGAVQARPAADLRHVEPAVLYWDEEVYHGAPAGLARVDLDRMQLQVRMPQTNNGYGYAFAGLEAIGCTSLDLGMRYDQYTPWKAYGNLVDNRFAGLVLDFHTARGYTRRVWLHYPPMRPAHPEQRSERRAPIWQMVLSRLQRVNEVNWEQVHGPLPAGTRVHLDLQQFAPRDWDGRFWLGAGVQDAGSGCGLEVSIQNGLPAAGS